MDFGPLDTFSNLLATHSVMASSAEGVADDIAFLKAILMDRPQELIEDGTLEESESVTREAGSIISSLDLQRVDKAMVVQLCRALTSPLRRLCVLKNKASINHYESSKQLKSSQMDFPRVDQLGFVEHLAAYLEELLQAKADAVAPLESYMSRLQQKLRPLGSHLMKIPEPRREQVDLKVLVNNITNLA